MTDTFKSQIKAFNTMYGLPVAEAPGFPFKTKISESLVARLTEFQKIMMDEVDEVEEIIEKIERGEHPVDVLTDLADWLGDLQVYCASEMMKFGLDNDAVLGIIMASNMSKLAEDGTVIMKEGKVMKGPNFYPPEPMIKRFIQASAAPLGVPGGSVGRRGYCSGIPHLKVACIHCQDEVSKLETINKELLNALRLFVAHSAPPECAIWRHVDDVARAAIARATGEKPWPQSGG